MLCCGYRLTDFPISIRLTSLALWQSNDCPSASKGTLMNMEKYFMWIHYERLHNHNKSKHNKTVCIFLGIYCTKTDNLPRFVSVQWHHTMTHILNPEIKFQVCHWQHQQRISRFIIRGEMRRTSMAKHCQIIYFKGSHCIINVVSSTQLGFPVSTVKILALTWRRWVCRALFDIRISSKSP